MADRFILAHIKRLPLFQQLTVEQLDWVASIGQVLRFNPGEIIFQQGKVNQGLMMFVSGGGTLTQVGPDQVERIVGKVAANEFVNESALFVETTASVTLKAADTSIVLFLPRQQMHTVLAQHPDVRQKLRGQQVYIPQVTSSGKVFEGQRDNETVLLTFHRHRWVFLRRLWLPLLLATFLLIVSALVGQYVGLIGAAIGGLAIIIPCGLAIYYYLDWHNDRVVITDRRVVQIEHNLLAFDTKVNQIALNSIQEVGITVPAGDPFSNILNYGTIVLKTSGVDKGTTIQFVPDPKAIQNVIFTNRNRYHENTAEQNRNTMRNELDKTLGGNAANDTVQKPPPPKQQGDGREHSILPVMRFVNDKGEIVYRKHYMVWLRAIIIPAVVMFIGMGLFLAQLIGASPLRNAGAVGLAVAVVMMILGGLWAYLSDWDWRNDLYILGDQTITLIHKRPLWLQNEKDQILLAQVDNVVSDTKGLLNNLFRIGDVRLLLTGAQEKNAKVFKNVYWPQRIQEEISQRQAQAEERAQTAKVKQEQQNIVQYLSVYHESVGAPPVVNAAPEVEQPPQIRDGSRPPNIPRVRGSNPPR
jgi:hypothetical protein